MSQLSHRPAPRNRRRQKTTSDIREAVTDLRLRGFAVWRVPKGGKNPLDPELPDFALLRLLGFRNREIADRLGCTERKVERKLNLSRLKWESGWPDDAGA